MSYQRFAARAIFFLHFGGPSEQFDIYEESIYSYKVDLKSIYHPNLFSDRFSITFPDQWCFDKY